MTKYACFDLETAKVVEGSLDLDRDRPLGITCAAVLLSDTMETRIACSKNPDGAFEPRMSRESVQAFVRSMVSHVENGYTLLTWNGLGFDFDVLAEESSMHEECAELALGHVDMMFHVFCLKGFPVGLQKAAEGLGLVGKYEGIKGGEAPTLWASGQCERVLRYVDGDVRLALSVARECERRQSFSWVTQKGKLSNMPLAKWLPVKDALKLPLPDVSWMSDPLPRERFTRWISSKSD